MTYKKAKQDIFTKGFLLFTDFTDHWSTVTVTQQQVCFRRFKVQLTVPIPVMGDMSSQDSGSCVSVSATGRQCPAEQSSPTSKVLHLTC